MECTDPFSLLYKLKATERKTTAKKNVYLEENNIRNEQINRQNSMIESMIVVGTIMGTVIAIAVLLAILYFLIL